MSDEMPTTQRPFDREMWLQICAEVNKGKLAQYEADVQMWLESWKAANESGREAIKACTLLNGGAAVAMLAFVGHLASIPTRPGLISTFEQPLLWFVAGTFLSVFGGCITYVGYRTVGKIFALRQAHKAAHNFEETPDGRPVAGGWGALSTILNGIAISCVIGALACFVYASWLSYQRFEKFHVPEIISVG
jgi:hypothetical protein